MGTTDQSPNSAPPAESIGTRRGELPKQYRPADHEPGVWQRWIDAGAFRADPARVARGEAEPYTILIPPPNVTAALHLGHALNNTLQDVLARVHRMRGHETLWMPGTDHAGIATQAVVEKRVFAEEGKRRTDFAREDFVARIQAFKDEYEATITGQLKAMGCSCDWDRQRFTMDPICARAVREAFFQLFKDGLIYRGKRLVNWDPVLQTAVADDECFDEEVDAHFYYLRYPLVHRHGASTQRERDRQQPEPQDAVPVTWDELAARGYPGADQHAGDEQAWVTVATTRPETYLGDTAVAINPRDPRAKALRDLCVELPIIGRVIPIIEDAYVVLPAAMQDDPEGDAAKDPKAQFATGFLKVTPAHDTNDYEIGQRHATTIQAFGLPVMINVMAPDGSISGSHGWSDQSETRAAHMFLGLSREAARKKVIEEFKARTVGASAAHLFADAKPYKHSVKMSDRSKAVIEPYLSDQWYVRVTDPRLAASANAALVPEQRTSDGIAATQTSADGDGSLRFHPARYAKTYEQWHDGIRDWCISRQLWWGHRIPVWAREIGSSADDAITQRLAAWEAAQRVSVRRPTHAGDRVMVCVRDADGPAGAGTGADAAIIRELEAVGFIRDPDVLDTWFSSALWPMSTMGWPKPEDHDATRGLLQAFNPTSVLCTAREIITLWVSRMVMFNRYFLGAGHGKGPVPFHDVFIHAVIQDGDGRKMSKSLGNGVDPLDIIATHGSDAMRYTLCHMATQTQDVRMPVVKDHASGKNTSPKFDLGRNFANKLWNAARFALSLASDGQGPHAVGPPLDPASLSLPDRWMLGRLSAAVHACDEALAAYQFSEYAQALYDLLWRDFCDWYLEAIKPTVASDPGQRATLVAVLDATLRLLHPVMPFVTEAIADVLRPVASSSPGIVGLSLRPSRHGTLLCTAGWPVMDQSLAKITGASTFEAVRDLVTAVREVRSQHGVRPKRRITLHAPASAGIAEHGDLLSALAGVATVTADAPAGPSVVMRAWNMELRLSNLHDASVDSSAERERLGKLVADLEKSIATLEARLANPGYAQKAPPAMVQQTKDQLSKARAERDAAGAALAALT